MNHPDPKKTSIQPPRNSYPFFNVYPSNHSPPSLSNHHQHSPSSSPSSFPAAGIAAVGGAIVGAMFRGATAGLRSTSNPTPSSSSSQRQPDHPPSSKLSPVLPADKRRNAKADQLIQHFYCKTTQLVIHSRMDPLPSPSAPLNSSLNSKPSSFKATASSNEGSALQLRRDKWFNLELDDLDYFKDELKTWKSVSGLLASSLSSSSSSTSLPSASASQQAPNFDLIPVMVFETILDTQDLPPDAVLVLSDSHGRDVRVDHRIPNAQPSEPVHKNIVLERWSVSLTGPFPPAPAPEPPTVYRHCIIHFRALYTFLRTMPSWRLCKRLRHAGRDAGLLKIGCRLSTTSRADEHRVHALFPHEIGLAEPLSTDPIPQPLATLAFPSVQTPCGALQTHVCYRTLPGFRITDKDALLSSCFVHEDRLERPLGLLSRGLLHNARPGTSAPMPPPIQAGQEAGQHAVAYGSLSSRHPIDWRRNSIDHELAHPAPVSTSSLTAAIRAAAESSPFTPSRHQQNSSALTAKLVGQGHSLAPVLSNALPVPATLNRSGSSCGGSRPAGSTGAGTWTGTGPACGGSPRQASLLSSSPRSGPSASLRISGAGGLQLPSPTQSPAGRGGQPMVRRYSSSRYSRSLGQSSGGGASVGMLESGSLGRRALMNSSSSEEAKMASRSTDAEADIQEINQFLAVIESQTIAEAEPTSDGDRDAAEDAELGRLVKEKLELTLKRLAGSVVAQEECLVGNGIGSGSWKALSRTGGALQGLREEDESGGGVSGSTSGEHDVGVGRIGIEL